MGSFILCMRLSQREVSADSVSQHARASRRPSHAVRLSPSLFRLFAIGWVRRRWQRWRRLRVTARAQEKPPEGSRLHREDTTPETRNYSKAHRQRMVRPVLLLLCMCDVLKGYLQMSGCHAKMESLLSQQVMQNLDHAIEGRFIHPDSANSIFARQPLIVAILRVAQA